MIKRENKLRTNFTCDIYIKTFYGIITDFCLTTDILLLKNPRKKKKYRKQRRRAGRTKLDQTNERGMDSTERYAEQLDDDLHYRNNSGPNNVLVSSTLNAKNISMLFSFMEAIAISSYSSNIAKSIKINYLPKKLEY
ncbi:hypothetical protein V1478_000482 [Vespula squamosa]|uniref:Uncharacterized protein n=1 Tax=Vespula squamosa TaxID=30214 RepID=A0ABD2C5L4_VESSQ